MREISLAPLMMLNFIVDFLELLIALKASGTWYVHSPATISLIVTHFLIGRLSVLFFRRLY